jgi:hypothetical protein
MQLEPDQSPKQSVFQKKYVWLGLAAYCVVVLLLILLV